MKIRIAQLMAAAATSFLLGQANADVVWTGAVDSDLTNDGNYDFTSSGLATVAGITSGTLAENLVYNSSGTMPIQGDLANQPTWGVAVGNTITFDGVTVDNGSGNDGWGFGEIFVINGASVTTFYMESQITVDSTSSVNLEGAGAPLPKLSTTLNLAPGAQVTLFSMDKFTLHASQIFVNGTSYADDNTVLSFNGLTATAVPEPGSLALLGLSGLLIARRRRD